MLKLCPSFRRNKALKDNKTYRCKRHGYNIISSKKHNFSALHVSIPVSLAYLSDIGNNQFSYLPLPERFNREKWVIILEIPVGALHSLISIHVKVALVIFFLTIFKFSLFWLHHKQQWYAWWHMSATWQNISTWDMLTCDSLKKLTPLSGMHSTNVCHHAVLKYYFTFRIYRDM